MPEVYHISNAGTMQQLAAQIVDRLAADDVVLLQGELGAGKTTFVQAVARVLGVVDVVTSPTFTLVAEYKTDGGRGIAALVHADLYRLPMQDGKSDPAVAEVLSRAREGGRLTFIEWPERLGEDPPLARWRLVFEHGAHSDERVVRIDQLSSAAAA